MQKGQALVETAIIAPVLIFLMIGVFEVGWALRSYLVLTNANREAARFAVRQDYLNFESDAIGYERVWTHTVESISGQIPFSDNGDMIISYLTIEATCTGAYTIVTPLDVPTYTWKYPPTSTRQTRLDYAALSSEALRQQRNYVCGLSGGRIPLNNNVVIVEMWMRHSQLFGFPLISNPYVNPLTLFTHTAMRKAPDSRD
jgi:hypothetical protein